MSYFSPSSFSPTSGSSSITTVGTINSGTWNGTIISGTYGGTGVNNGSRTLTILNSNVSTNDAAGTSTLTIGTRSFAFQGSSLTFSGNFSTTVTVTGSTSVTLPTSGTLVNTAVTTLSSLSSVGTITAGVWNGTVVDVAYGGTGQSSYTNGQLLIGNTTGNTLAKANLTAGNGISITNGAGSITVAANINSTNLQITASQINTIQDITTTSSPIFGGLLLNKSSLVVSTAKLHVEQAITNGCIVNYFNGISNGESIAYRMGQGSAAKNEIQFNFNYLSNNSAGNSATFGFNGVSTSQLYLEATTNIGFNGSNFGSGTGVLFIANAGSNPSGSPSGGYLLYSSSGSLKGKGTSGTVTNIGTADPHCPICDSDFAVEWENEKYGGKLTICMKCLVGEWGSRPYIRWNEPIEGTIQ